MNRSRFTKSSLLFKCLSKRHYKSNDRTHRNTRILTLAVQHPRGTKPRIGGQDLVLSFYFLRILDDDSTKQGETNTCW